MSKLECITEIDLSERFETTDQELEQILKSPKLSGLISVTLIKTGGMTDNAILSLAKTQFSSRT